MSQVLFYGIDLGMQAENTSHAKKIEIWWAWSSITLSGMKWIWNQLVNLNRLSRRIAAKSCVLRMLVHKFLCSVNDSRALVGVCLLVMSQWGQIPEINPSNHLRRGVTNMYQISNKETITIIYNFKILTIYPLLNAITVKIGLSPITFQLILHITLCLIYISSLMTVYVKRYGNLATSTLDCYCHLYSCIAKIFNLTVFEINALVKND